MAKSMYSHMADAWKRPSSGDRVKVYRDRLYEWRNGPTFVRVERPLRLDRARALGYKAKTGFVVVRAKVRRGGLHKRHPVRGRHPKHTGIVKITMGKSIRRIAEERVQKHYPNLRILNSYWIGEDGMHKYFEVICVDPERPEIRNDSTINWIIQANKKGRANRGLTGAGKKGRGLYHKGTGAEKRRPSMHGKTNFGRGK
jgi:large subunit ribosomal protein L15e